MSESVNIALDAMGGDNAPHIVIAGANIARRRYPNVRFLLFGDREEIEPRVAKQRGLAEFVEIHHTPERVTADDKPSQVLRSGRSTSMWLAITMCGWKAVSIERVRQHRLGCHGRR